MFDLDIGPAEAETGDEPIDLRMFVHLDDRALSETWLFQVFPSQIRAFLASHA